MQGKTPYHPLRNDSNDHPSPHDDHPRCTPRRHLAHPVHGTPRPVGQRLAIRLHVPAPRVNDIVRERRGISPDSALRLARYFGTAPQYWMDLQTAYDLRVAAELAGEQIRREVRARQRTARRAEGRLSKGPPQALCPLSPH